MSDDVPDENEAWRRYQLLTAFGAPEPVEIDGIILDLACDLDTESWRPVAPLGTYARQALRYGPRIAFPWTPQDWIDHWREHEGYVDAPAGSRIKIALIRSMPLGSSFKTLDFEESREFKQAYLWVFTPDGEMAVADPPLVLVAETATLAQIDLDQFHRAYGGLVMKLERMIGSTDLEDRLTGPEENWPSLPPDLPLTYRRALHALREAVEGLDEHAYAAFGYLMARAEAEQQLLDLALREHQAGEHRARGAMARRTRSRIKTEPLRDHAKRLMRGNRTLSLGSCARAVSKLVLDEPSLKLNGDPDWIADHIRELFDKRDIGGKVEYRPKDEWVRED